ncbi:MAG: GAF domain-containing protein [Aphanocapsa sp. GSE-SYN-MK-11-07L]|nr:GAF domain-containing protein [Aphanocapsa sp. GSE-SYN-MK-11-07L]
MKQLDQHYPQLGQPTPDQTRRIATSQIQTNQLDLEAVVESIQAIASQHDLKDCLPALLKILIDHAGAEVGYLFLHTPSASGEVGQFAIAASSSLVPTAKPINQILPVSVLHYVARKRERVLLNNAVVEGDFSSDPYIQLAQPLSILCYPLINQDKLFGIVYLENNLTTAAFSAERVQLLHLLSGQVAIATENAMLSLKLAWWESRAVNNNQTNKSARPLSSADKQLQFQE